MVKKESIIGFLQSLCINPDSRKKIMNVIASSEVIKLIAHAELGSDGKLTCSVKPQRISKDHPLAGDVLEIMRGL